MPPKPRKRLSGSETTFGETTSKKQKKVEEKTPNKNEKGRKSRKQHVSPENSKAKILSDAVKKGNSPKIVKKSPTKKMKKSVEADVTMPLKDINDLNISQLLALGENFKVEDAVPQNSDSEFSDSESNDDFEEVQNSEMKTPEIPKEGVSIVLEMPLMKKKKNKDFDPDAHIRREINRVKRGIQLLMHQVHVLCWIAHLKFINSTLNLPSLMKSCIALVKSKNLYPSKYSDLSYLEGILKWFHKTFELDTDCLEPKCSGGILNELIYQIENKKVYSSRDFTLIFITLLRTLGLKTRIVMSFQVVPLKPPSSELLDNKANKESSKSNKKHENVNESMLPSRSEGESSKKINSLPLGSGTKCNEKSQCIEISTEKNNVKRKSKKEKALEPEKCIVTKGKKSSKKSKTEEKKKSEKIDLSSTSEDDEDFKADSLKKIREKKKAPSRKSTSSSEDSLVVKKKGSDVWAEVFVEAEEKWISVDVPRKKIHCVNELYSRATHPVLYLVAGNNDLTLKDVTKRYVPHWHSDTKKKRVNEEWWGETMQPYLPPKSALDQEEDDDIARQLQDQPLPTVISEYKDHPLYALKRHLLKFEAFYPPDAPTLGFVRGEPVYARECVHTLHSREMWYKQARVVRLKEEPYKIVKARPKYDKMTGEIKKDMPLELFGKWQTEDYIPPIAVDGKVPRNEYGNVDLFKPCMLPIGTVHLQIPLLNKVAKKLGIDCAPATVGFEFHSGGSHPVFDGFVVCEEFKDILLDTWNKEVDESAKRNEEKKEKRVYSNWKRLIRGLLIREKLKLKYAFGEGESKDEGSSVDKV